MTTTKRTNGPSRRKELALKLILAIGEAVGLAFGMAPRKSAEWN